MADKRLPHQDTAYSWLVLAASSGLELLYASGVGTIGVLIVHLTEIFNVRKSAITWVGGLLLFSGFILGFIPSNLARRYGVRPVGWAASILGCASCVLSSFATSVNLLYFTHGILASLAFCTFFNLASISGQQYFHRRRALASGVTMASISAGLLIWPPACQLLIDGYGWRGAFIIMGGIQLHGLVFSSLIRPVPSIRSFTAANKEKQDGEIALVENRGADLNQGTTGTAEENGNKKDSGENTEDMIELEVISDEDKEAQSEQPVGEEGDARSKPSSCTSGWGIITMVKTSCSPVTSTPRYLIYLIGIFLIQTGHITAISMLPLRASALDLTKTQGASLVSILGGLGGLGRACFGFVGDWHRVNRSMIVGMSGLVSGLLTCGMGYLTTYAQLAGTTALLGLTSAAYNALQGACVIDQVGREMLAPGIGLLSVSMGFGRLSALLISGAVLDILDDPRYVFVLFGLVEAVGGLFLPLVVLLMRRAAYYNVTLNDTHDQQ